MLMPELLEDNSFGKTRSLQDLHQLNVITFAALLKIVHLISLDCLRAQIHRDNASYRLLCDWNEWTTQSRRLLINDKSNDLQPK